MRAPKIAVAALAVAFALSVFSVFAQAATETQQDTRKPEAKQQERIYIPKEIKAVMQEGLATRQGRQDIPFSVFQDFFFPTQVENLHTVFFFKAQNAALGFAAPAPPPAPKKKGEQPPAAAPEGVLEAPLDVFLQFLQPDGTGALKTYQEAFVPVTLQEESAGFDPAKEEWYSINYLLPPGTYTLAMALTSKDLKKVGVAYLDFTLPGPASYAQTLETTPMFFVKSMEQMQTPENRIMIHKGYFTYSVLQIVPDLAETVKPGEQVELFYYVFGARPKSAEPGQQPVYDMEVDYEVQQEDGTVAIKWAPSTSAISIISQPLPLKQTVKITKGEEEHTETRDLTAGKYVLVITVKDKVSGESVQKKLPFEIV